MTIRFAMFFLSAIWCARIFALQPAEMKLDVLDLNPPPNYYLSTDNDDRGQLTDGSINDFPIWSKRQSVGWAKKTPVTIKLEFKQSSSTSRKGVLRLHSSQGLYANVRIPTQINVYAGSSESELAYVGTYQKSPGAWADQQNHWIDIDLDGNGKFLEIVIHADGKYVFLDEIEWIPQPGIPRILTGPWLSPDQVLVDSQARVRAFFELGGNTANLKTAARQGDQSANVPRVWIEDPWVALNQYPDSERGNADLKAIELFGFQDDRESVCLGLFNPGDNPIQYHIRLKDSDDSAFEIGLVKSVLSAEGQRIFDPILALSKSEVISLERKQIGYVWLTFDLSKMPRGRTSNEVIVLERNQGLEYRFPLAIQVENSGWADYSPAAVNWAYTLDLPIWQQEEPVIRDLERHGIDVFVVHPKHIPQPNPEGRWSDVLAEALRKDIALFQGHRQILLYLGWLPNRRPAWLGEHSEIDEQSQQRIVTDWLIRLNEFLGGLGLQNRDWALYPVDEPNGERLDLLLKVARWFKQANPKVRVYANPTASRVGSATPGQLRKLAPWIDIWQPSLDFAERPGKDFFQKLQIAWWTYHNPKSPAKAAEPLNDYRLPGWRAWRLGASGLGFWSYSDTAGSSAWDDLDGERPDWAVVYESESGPVSSRRWEAFRESAEDFRLLRTVEFMARSNANDSCEVDAAISEIKATIDAKELESKRLNRYRELLFRKYACLAKSKGGSVS